MRTREDPVDLLTQLVAMPTVSSSPLDAMVDALAQRATDCGGCTEVLSSSPGKANVIARFGPPETDGLVISGHMDVVPIEGQIWASDPFKLTRRDEKLFGRGTADMKGFLAAVTVALQQIDPSKLRRELVIIWTHDEEVGCLGSKILADKWSDSLAPLPTQGWIGEPTDLRICRMHPGHSSVEITCTGRAAHSSRPSLGINAIQLAQRVLAELEHLSESWRQNRRYEDHLASPFTVMNVGQISGGTAINIVPEQCTIQVGFRPLPGMCAQEKIREIDHSLRSARQHARYLGGDISIRTLQIGPALLTEDGTRLQDHLCPHATDPKATAAPFATDGGNLQSLGISSLVFGPGSIDVAHRADEFIPESELRQCVTTVQSVINQMCVAEQNPA